MTTKKYLNISMIVLLIQGIGLLIGKLLGYGKILVPGWLALIFAIIDINVFVAIGMDMYYHFNPKKQQL